MQKELKTDLESLLVQINEQIHAIEEVAMFEDIPVEQLRTPNGDWPMVNLLCAKAQVVSSMVAIRPQVIINNHPGKGKW